MPSSKHALATPTSLKPEDKHRALRVVIETPKGSRNKYAFNPKLRAFELRKVLPAGMTFPFDFGFVPSTRGGDGDPLDVLVLMDEPAFPGCVLSCRVIGVIRGRQKRHGDGHEINDRVIAIECKNHSYASISTLKDLGKQFVQELEEFFTNYHALDGDRFKVTGTGGPALARRIIKAAMKAEGRRS